MDDCRALLTEYYSAEWQTLVDEATRLLHGDRMTAEDVVQTTFLRLLTQHAIANTPVLVRVTMLNILRDLWRRRRHEQDCERRLAASPICHGQTDDVFSICSARQITELLEHRLARMEKSVAQAMRMNILEGMAVSEISETLSARYKTIENRLQTGRRQLRSYMRRVS